MLQAILCPVCETPLGPEAICLSCSSDCSILRLVAERSIGIRSTAIELMKRGEWPQASSAMTQSLRLLSEDSLSWNLFGICLWYGGRANAAIAAWRRSLTLKKPGNPAETYIRLAAPAVDYLANWAGEVAANDGEELLLTAATPLPYRKIASIAGRAAGLQLLSPPLAKTQGVGDEAPPRHQRPWHDRPLTILRVVEAACILVIAGIAIRSLHRHSEAPTPLPTPPSPQQIVTTASTVLSTISQSEKISLAHAYYAAGRRAFKRKDFQSSAELFAVAASYSGSDYIEDDATYYSALSSLNSGKQIEAADRFEEFLKQFPQSEYRDDALFQLYRIEKQNGNQEKARKFAQEIIETIPDSSYARWLHPNPPHQ